MALDTTICEQARQTRDSRFDGHFFVGVKTTGIYCRPICPVRLPKRENVAFYQSAAAASEAGFRPCLRCRPESAPGTPAWRGTSTTVTRALSLIHGGALDQSSVTALSDRLGITSRHLGRLFQQYLGASPLAIAQTRRLHFAKKLIDETGMPMTEIAMASGYGSIRRFNDHFRKVYNRPPSSLRSDQTVHAEPQFTLKLAYREPYCWKSITGFLAKRAVPGVEWVTDGVWHRHIQLESETGHISVSQSHTEPALLCNIDIPSSTSLYAIKERIRNLFDLDADPTEIADALSHDPILRKRVKKNPGVRVPGAWDSFEVAVRAIVGQQISVTGATTVMGRIASRYGAPLQTGYTFPTPDVLMNADPADFPMPQSRARAIINLATAVAKDEIKLNRWIESDLLKQQLMALKGIGEWTASYITMRVLSDPDAFLHSDLVLLKVAHHLYGDDNPKALLERSMNWRPWRAYAGMHLWRAASEIKG